MLDRPSWFSDLVTHSLTRLKAKVTTHPTIENSTVQGWFDDKIVGHFDLIMDIKVLFRPVGNRLDNTSRLHVNLRVPIPTTLISSSKMKLIGQEEFDLLVISFLWIVRYLSKIFY